ncbi:MAG: hypothetical protein M3Y03_01435 [Verrucomicrobiota bacterium]|nr:hypothetical protein [Verrucomicrobiota bacterium]
MTSNPSDGFRLNVLNPGGRDSEQHFTDSLGEEGKEHAPVNFHAYAACTGGSFFRETKRALAAGGPVLLLLRGDFAASERALIELQKAGIRVAVSLKETGLHQIAEQLRDRTRLQRFLRIVRAAAGCLAPTPEAADIYRSVRGHDSLVAFIPTPYPVHDPRWDFSPPPAERHGIFVGTREWDVPSRNHAAALLAVRQISETTGESVTVYDFAKRRGTRLLAELGFAEGRLRVLTARTGYADYLRILAQHKIVFQLDTSFVPGQVAGDALLARVPCVGGNGAIERIAFPDLCGAGRSIAELSAIAVRLLQDEALRAAAINVSLGRANEQLSFSRVAQQLSNSFAPEIR